MERRRQGKAALLFGWNYHGENFLKWWAGLNSLTLISPNSRFRIFSALWKRGKDSKEDSEKGDKR